MWLKEQPARLSAKSRLSGKLAYIVRHRDGRVEMDSKQRGEPDPPGCSEPQECVVGRPRRRGRGLDRR